jgi:hypothetical protein
MIPLLSKLININKNGREIPGRVQESTEKAIAELNEAYSQTPIDEIGTEEDRNKEKTEIARTLCTAYIDSLYRRGIYIFPEPNPKAKYAHRKLGLGIKGKAKKGAKKGAKYGKGMAIEMKGVTAPVPVRPDRSDLYYSFGVFAVHKKSLGDNVLNLKYKSFSQVHKFPKRAISEDLKDIILDAIETKKINNKLFNALAEADKIYLRDVVTEAKLASVFPNIYPKLVSGDGVAVNSDPYERFDILKGELIAGNNNPEIKKEMRLLVNKFMKENLISSKDGFGILELL